MKKYLAILGICVLMLAGCGDTLDVVRGVDGKDGSNGTNGRDGFSLVSQTTSLSQESIECGELGGSRLDMFLDLDYSMSLSDGDLYQGSLLACNGQRGYQGMPGATGPQGEPGTAVVAVKLCADDTSTYPEYGFRIGTYIYALLVTGNPDRTGLTRLLPRSYRSTLGNGCYFTVYSNGEVSQ